MTKRFRPFGEEEAEQGLMESINLANVLVLLSRGQETAGGGAFVRGTGVAEGRVFECKTCSRQFPSFQALGGHRASHKKPRQGGDGPEQAHGGPRKPRVHECSVCGLEFAIGQALGGHMRRHRSVTEGNGLGLADGPAVVDRLAEKSRAVFDLNLPPLEPAEEVRRLPKLLGFQLTPAMVDCYH